MKSQKKSIESLFSLDDILLSDDDLIEIKGGIDDGVNCGAGCGVGCGAGCGAGCAGCSDQPIKPTTRI